MIDWLLTQSSVGNSLICRVAMFRSLIRARSQSSSSLVTMSWVPFITWCSSNKALIFAGLFLFLSIKRFDQLYWFSFFFWALAEWGYVPVVYFYCYIIVWFLRKSIAQLCDLIDYDDPYCLSVDSSITQRGNSRPLSEAAGSHSSDKVKRSYLLIHYLLSLWTYHNGFEIVTFCLEMQILVLGGNGYVGSHICKEALRQGFSVSSLSR